MSDCFVMGLGRRSLSVEDVMGGFKGVPCGVDGKFRSQ